MGGKSANTWAAKYELSEKESLKLPFLGVDLPKLGRQNMSSQGRNLYMPIDMGGKSANTRSAKYEFSE